ncbi:MAG: putative Ig domain-containing protein, partial [Methylovulum sp.]|nr:putative Ig domain-containing protein [Methylovulum sp.]
LYGDEGADKLTGGTGNDYLEGNAGADTYLFGKADGQDEIYNWDADNSVDTVQFINVASTGISAKYRDPGSANYNDGALMLQYGIGGQLKLNHYFYDPSYRIDQFKFSDGVIWGWDDLKALGLIGTVFDDSIHGYTGDNNTLKGLVGNDYLKGAELGDVLDGGSEDDHLYGNDGNDKLIGGKGKDYMEGNGGADTYLITKADGHDEIYNWDGDNGSIDTVQFINVATTDISAVQHSDNDSLILTYGVNGQLIVDYYFSNPDYRVDQFVFTDATWTYSNIIGNNAPKASNQTVAMDEDTALVFTADHFGFIDKDSNDSLQAIKITQLPGTGAFTLNGVAITLDQIIVIDDINPGHLVFTPAANAYGNHYADFNFKVSDGTDFSASAYLMTLNVTAVNDAPVAAHVLNDQTASHNAVFSYTIPANSFIDADVGDTLNYTASTADGFVLPAWLSFNGNTRTFSGTPGAADSGTLTIIVTATDSANASVSSPFVLTVAHNNTAPVFSAVGDGKVTTAIGAYADWGQSVSMQADGKILVAGYSEKAVGAVFALARYNSDGILDTHFSGDGKLTTALGSSDDRAYSATVQADGKILVAGYSWNGNDYDFALVRYKANGNLDSSFDADGKVTTDFGPSTALGLSTTHADFGDRAYSITVQTNGKILVAGFSSNGHTENFALARYNSDGSLDTGFSGDGKVTTDFNAATDFGQSVTVQADGKILVAGYSYNAVDSNFELVRYNSDGSLDTSFDGDGKVTTDFGYAADWGQSITAQSDGKILVAGYNFNTSGSNFELARYNSDGSLDTGFDDDGKVTTDFSSATDWGQSVTVQADGKILVAGSSYNGGWNFAIARYLSDGSLDASFDGDGKVTTDFTFASDDMAYAITVQNNGKILVAGHSASTFALARYNADGSLDSSFGAVDPAGNTVSYVKNGAAVVLSSATHIYDAELAAQGQYNGASITLARHGGANNQDLFSSGNSEFNISGNNALLSGIAIGTVSNSNGALTIHFNDNASQARVDTALSSLAYSNNAGNPPHTVQIDWTFNDGDTAGSLTASRSTTVNITAASTAAASAYLNPGASAVNSMLKYGLMDTASIYGENNTDIQLTGIIDDCMHASGLTANAMWLV